MVLSLILSALTRVVTCGTQLSGMRAVLPALCRLSSAAKHSDNLDSGRGLQEARHCAINEVALQFLSMDQETLTEIMSVGSLWKYQ
jgi:hypothetical protein